VIIDETDYTGYDKVEYNKLVATSVDDFIAVSEKAI
jgi:hypothetical protein